jgi:hypothetical protein
MFGLAVPLNDAGRGDYWNGDSSDTHNELASYKSSTMGNWPASPLPTGSKPRMPHWVGHLEERFRKSNLGVLAGLPQ